MPFLGKRKPTSLLQPGDIIIMSPRISAEDSALKRILWQKTSPALQGSLTHSAVVGPDGQVIESRAGEGITKKPFAAAVADRQYVVKRPPFTETTRRRAAEFAEKQLGKEYGWSDLLLQAVGGLLPRSATVGISERLQLPRERKGYTCSSLITAAYGRAHLADVPARATLPADLRFADRLQEVVNKAKAEHLPAIGRVSRTVAQDKTAGPPSFMKPDVALRPHQEEAVRKLVRQNGNLILSHPVGSGKTISVIAGVDRMRQLGTASRTLVVVPASLRGNFVAEVQKHTNAKAAIFGNSQEVAAGQGRHVDNPDPKADFHLVSYEMFRTNPEAYIKASGADTVVYDELHKIKNVGATGTALKEARKHHRNFIGLTGSIVSNTPADLVPLVDAMTEGKHHLGTKENFERRFMTEDGKMQHTLVMRMLLNPYIHHVDPQANEHTPRKVVEHIHVEMSPEQQELYQYVIGKMDPITALKFRFGSSKLKSNDVNNIFNKMTQARQVANSIHTVNKSVTLSESAQRTPKIKRVLDDVTQHLGETPDGQVIIYSNIIQGGVDVLSQGLKDRGIAHGVFVGKGQPGSTEASRQQAVRDYQEGKKRVILLSSAGGEGLNLGNTTLVANVDGHFNPEKIFQAEARGIRAGGQAHRPQEARKVIVRRYLTRVPISKSQAARDAMNLVSPNQALNRLFDGQPLLYNPFKRERSPDEWAYEVAARKDTRNKDLRQNLDKTSSRHPTDPGVPVTVEDMIDLIEIGLAERAEDTTKEAAVKAKENTAERRLAVQRLPMQPYRLVKSDTPVMNAYLKEFGRYLEDAPDLTTALPPSALAREQQYIDALRAYYRESAKPHGALPGKAKTDEERKKEVIKASLLGGLSLGASLGLYTTLATGHFDKTSIPIGLVAGATAGIPTTGLLLWKGLRTPTFATAAARAKRMGRLSDEQMRLLLRGLEVRQKEEKTHRLAVGSSARAVTKQVQGG